MLTCPWCRMPAMTLGQKASLGPGRVVQCRACRRNISSHPIAILGALPAFLGGYAFLNTESVPLGFLAVVAGLAGMALLQIFAVPLTKA